jgi:hypothetical protein
LTLLSKAPDALIDLGDSPELRGQAAPQLRFTERARPEQRQSCSKYFLAESPGVALIII